MYQSPDGLQRPRALPAVRTQDSRSGTKVLCAFRRRGKMVTKAGRSSDRATDGQCTYSAPNQKAVHSSQRSKHCPDRSSQVANMSRSYGRLASQQDARKKAKRAAKTAQRPAKQHLAGFGSPRPDASKIRDSGMPSGTLNFLLAELRWSERPSLPRRNLHHADLKLPKVLCAASG